MSVFLLAGLVLAVSIKSATLFRVNKGLRVICIEPFVLYGVSINMWLFYVADVLLYYI